MYLFLMWYEQFCAIFTSINHQFLAIQVLFWPLKEDKIYDLQSLIIAT